LHIISLRVFVWSTIFSIFIHQQTVLHQSAGDSDYSRSILTIFYLRLFYEPGLMTLNSIITCVVDSTFGFYVYQFSSTLRAIISTLMNPLSTEKFSDFLKMCAVKHQKLLQCRNSLEHVYGPIVFWHVVTNAMLICMSIYDFTSVCKH